MLDTIFRRLNLGEYETRTYLVLLEHGPSTAGTLAKKLGVPRSSLYGFLSNLADKGLVSMSEEDAVKTWHAQAPSTIAGVIDRELDGWTRTKKDFEGVLPDLLSKFTNDLSIPRFRTFEGIEGLRRVLEDMLLHYDIETESFWPIKDMIEMLGSDFFVYLNARRIRQGIYTRAIWPKDRAVDIKKHPYLGVGEAFKREIRYAPEPIDCSMGYWAYENKVAFISSRKESFGFLVESKELRRMLKTQFEMIWKISTPIEVPVTDTVSFLRDHVRNRAAR